MTDLYTFPCPVCSSLIFMSAYVEVEGDASEPGGRLIHRYVTAEVSSQTCDCDLTDAHYATLVNAAIDAYTQER